MTTNNFCFYLQNRLIQTSQTGGQWYSDTSSFSIPCYNILYNGLDLRILANEVGWRFAKTYSMHNTGQGTIPMDNLMTGTSESYQRLMQIVLGNIQNIIIYIDNLLIHTDTY